MSVSTSMDVYTKKSVIAIINTMLTIHTKTAITTGSMEVLVVPIVPSIGIRSMYNTYNIYNALLQQL